MTINWPVTVGCLIAGAVLFIPAIAIGARRFTEGRTDDAEDLLWLCAAVLGVLLLIAGVMAIAYAAAT